MRPHEIKMTKLRIDFFDTIDKFKLTTPIRNCFIECYFRENIAKWFDRNSSSSFVCALIPYLYRKSSGYLRKKCNSPYFPKIY